MKFDQPAQRVVNAARDWLGTPYCHQASAKGVGCDCLGLVRGVWRKVEGQEPEAIPAYSSTWSEVSRRERLIEIGNRYFAPVEASQRQIGDMLVFRMRRSAVAKHAGILVGRDTFIHAYQGTEVTQTSLCDFWRSRIAAVFRFPSVACSPDTSSYCEGRI